MKKINIEFTKEEYLELMKLTYIGEFIINGHKIDKFNESARKLLANLVKQAEKNKIMDYIDYSEYSKKYGFSQEMEFKLYEDISNYVEQSMNNELVETVGLNAIYEKYSENDIQKMEEDKREKLFSDSYDIVQNEFLNNGYSNLVIKKINPLFLKKN